MDNIFGGLGGVGVDRSSGVSQHIQTNKLRPTSLGIQATSLLVNRCFATRNPRISGRVPTLAKPSACSVAGLLRNGKQVTQ